MRNINNDLIRLLTERQSIWERLRKCGRPIIIYGMGNGADKIMDVLEHIGAPVAGVVASDGFVRGHSFRGFKVGSVSGIEKNFIDPVILMSFATQLPTVIEDIRALSERYEVLAPDVPVYGDTLFDWDFLERNSGEIYDVYLKLVDEESRREYLNVLNYKVSGKIAYLQGVKPYGFGYGLLEPSGNDIFVDAGAYKGDTVKAFMEFCENRYAEITAMEPDAKNFSKLLQYTKDINEDKIKCLNIAAWDKKDNLFFSQSSGRQNSVIINHGRDSKANTCADSIDNILAGKPATIIKYDVEGSESEALEGSKGTVREHRPALIISAYHKSADIFELPLKALDYNPGYRLFFRRPPYIPAWDTVFILK